MKRKPAHEYGDGRLSTCKCGRAVVRSPMNPKVRICDGCWGSQTNCQCKPLPDEIPQPVGDTP